MSSADTEKKEDGNMVEDTSIEAYESTVSERMAQRERVLEIVREAKHPSSSDIARFTRIPRTSVTGRLRELEQDGLIMKGGTKLDPHTGKRVKWYKIVEKKPFWQAGYL